MGLDIQQESFCDADYQRFSKRLHESLDVLRALIKRPGFGYGPPSLGVEMEMYLIDAQGEPSPTNMEVLSACKDDRIAHELNRFNIEFASDPVSMAGRPFEALSKEASDAARRVARAAETVGAKVATLGILPTLRQTHMGPAAMTDRPRYRALAAGLSRLRQAPFHIAIDGEQPLELESNDISLEGANTSWQIHLKCAPERFGAVYNASQLAIAPVLAAAGNSPFLFGHRLWEETRIALFKQSVDVRVDLGKEWHLPARVGFGSGWVREGAWELFAECIALHPPILPVIGPDDPKDAVGNSQLTPSLHELRLHQGTVWRWNRPIYDPSGGGHVRTELRALPAGPSMPDMMANTAFVLGAHAGFGSGHGRDVGPFPFRVCPP